MLKPSAVEPVFATLEQSLALCRLGALGSEDRAVLKTAIAETIGQVRHDPRRLFRAPLPAISCFDNEKMIYFYTTLVLFDR